MRRCDGEECYEKTPIGLIPSKGSLNLEGMKEKIDLDEIFKVEKDFWLKEVQEIQQYFDEQVGDGLPKAIQEEIDSLKKRVSEM